MIHDALPGLNYLRLAKLATWYFRVGQIVARLWNRGKEGERSYKQIKAERFGPEIEGIGPLCP